MPAPCQAGAGTGEPSVAGAKSPSGPAGAGTRAPKHPGYSPGMGRSLRVALLSYRSKPHGGGQGVYVRALSRELRELGHRVEVLSGQPYPELDDGVPLTRVPSLDLYREPDPFRTQRPRAVSPPAPAPPALAR